MKANRLFIFVAAAVMSVAAGCSKYDDTAILQQLKDHEERIAGLETLCAQLNTSISSIQVILNALANKDYVTAVIPVKEGDEVIGYTVQFEKSGDITIYNGKNGSSPAVAVKEDTDGILYWTVNGEWLLDANGAKVRASAEDGITPIFRIEDGKWFISTDNGSTWAEAGQATGDSMFKDVVVGEDTVEFILADGTSFSIPKNTADFFTIPYGIIMLSERFDDVVKGDTLAVDFVVNPSNFKLNPDDLSLLVSNDIYTKYDIVTVEKDGEMVEEETPFDETAHCDFNIIHVEQAGDYPGSYRAFIAVGGEGNFFDDARIYLLYGNKDSKDEQRYICANTEFDINVIPSLGEAFTLASGHQSFQTFNKETRSPGSVKDYVIALWANTYKNIGGAIRVYDKTKVQSVSSTNADFKFDSKYFTDYGFLTLTPDTGSEFWAPYINPGEDDEEKEEAPDYVEFEESINLTRASENASYPFTGRTYFNVIVNEEESITESALREKIAGKENFSFDLMPAYTKCGAYDADFTSYRSIGTGINNATFESSNLFLFKLNMETMKFEGRFTSFPKCNPAGWVYLFGYDLKVSQAKDGQMVPALPEGFDGSLMEFCVIHQIDIAMGE